MCIKDLARTVGV
ncbi:hypothetical protein F383_30455 [Gossypium arboreum]|uniref:Uncharacterized protein n=1 Tax=Gossypium arboreum TaxID=29729 RepID=A0A0B0MXF3_GOSAR|nr:hypothetical protein F383_30455 [Gossypium arboreum]